MKSATVRNAAALMLGASAVVWGTTAAAQNVVVQPGQPAPAAQPAPPPAQPPASQNNVVVTPGASPGVTQAQPAEPGTSSAAVAVAPAAEGTVHPETRPNRALLMSGLVLFGAPYVASLSIAATSPHAGDSNLYVPVMGPWLDLGNRPGCSGDCGNETGNKVLLVGDGILQTVGALQIIGAFVFPETITVPTVAMGKNAEVSFTPSKVGYQGYGMSAVGHF